MTVGSNLRRLRKERGLEQAELAERARSSQQTISDIERGKRDPRESTLEKLAEALGVSVGALFADGDGTTPVPPRPRTPRTDEKEERFDERFAATDLNGAERLREKVDAEFGKLQRYVEALEAAGVSDTDFKLKRARAHLAEAKRRLYAITSRATDLALNAEFGRDKPIYDTVEAYVGKALEVDEKHREDAARQRVEQSGKAG
jgi:transcriptional regulator with XRE-family HTH domain